jgi:RNA polymerase sigma-70 factor (ECF subfamily)
MTDPRSDDDLMLAYARGDAAAFEALYERYRKPLYRYLFHAARDRAVADELFQDVWMRIVDARKRFRKDAGFKRYAFRIAHNRLVDHWRALDRRREEAGAAATEPVSAPQDSPEAIVERSEQRGELQQALGRLSRVQRESFLLQQEAGLTLEEIAERSGVGRETVKSRLRYATGKLRTLLKPATSTSEP